MSRHYRTLDKLIDSNLRKGEEEVRAYVAASIEMYNEDNNLKALIKSIKRVEKIINENKD
jgi:hypothetical protein